jgi:hypothetical protein
MFEYIIKAREKSEPLVITPQSVLELINSTHCVDSDFTYEFENDDSQTIKIPNSMKMGPDNVTVEGSSLADIGFWNMNLLVMDA